MAELDIRPVRSARDRRAFIEVAWHTCGHDPVWVPPLIADMKAMIDPRKGVFFGEGEAELFLAYRDGVPVGRISAQVSRRHDELYADQKGFFGFFECEHRAETAHALFDAAEKALIARGKRRVEGPYNFTIYDEIGVLVEGFDSPPYVLNVHNPPYYGELLDGAGYRKAVDWYAYRIDGERARQQWPQRLKQLKQRLLDRQGMSLRTVDLEHLDREAHAIRGIFDSAWSRNYGHVPLSERQFERLFDGLRQIVIPELSLIAEVNGRPVGFALAIYDANPIVREIGGRLFPLGFIKLLRGVKRVKRFRLLLMGVLEAYQGRGYEIVFTTEIAERGLQLGFVECEMSNIVETNEPMLRSLAHLPAERYKTYRIYEKDLDAG